MDLLPEDLFDRPSKHAGLLLLPTVTAAVWLTAPGRWALFKLAGTALWLVAGVLLGWALSRRCGRRSSLHLHLRGAEERGATPLAGEQAGHAAVAATPGCAAVGGMQASAVGGDGAAGSAAAGVRGGDAARASRGTGLPASKKPAVNMKGDKKALRFEGVAYTYPYPWEQVVEGLWKKYPRPLPCEMNRELLAIDTTKEDYSADWDCVFRHRVFTLNNALPSILKSLFRTKYLVFEEDTVEDRRERVLTLRSWNKTFQRMGKTTELSSYTVHPDNPQWTLFSQRGEARASRWCGPSRGLVERTIRDMFNDMAPGSCTNLDKRLRELFGPPKFGEPAQPLRRAP